MITKLHYEVKVRYERIDDLGKAKKSNRGLYRLCSHVA